ncbi:hypothetical protein HPB52_010948 [Rhipicephalus sanguineus]|uniref:Uncharacterized protein n=1 Tax=Rhipicephalus sanguineus TaxID=34632 RepID=A0A9D4PJ21_RHISA|nr:hypothetical protein HPB52_010948 [Rhipicephalus sanguineus]
MLRALSRCIVPGVGGLRRCPPGGPVHVQPPGTGLPLFVGIVTRHREAVSARSQHGPSLDSTDRPVAWTSRLLGRSSPALYLATHPSMLRSRSVDSFSRIGTRLSHHSPTRPRRPGSFARFAGSQKFPAGAHQDGSLQRSRLLAATIRDTIPRPPQPPPAPTTVEAAVALLRSARPDLLAQGALPASTSVPPPTLPPQPPQLDFDE